MRTLPVLLLALGLAACGAPAGEDSLEEVPPAGGPASSGEASPSGPQAPPSTRPLVLQQPPQDVSGPFYVARTDGPDALLVTFTGAPEGVGPCGVAEYVGRLEPTGDGLRLVVEPRYTGQQPDGDTACTLAGAGRQLWAELDEPLDGRRVVDEQGHALLIVDGDQLLRFGELPTDWSGGPEAGGGGPVAWSQQLRGPGGITAELRQGSPVIAQPGPKVFGYREIGSPTVRGVPAVLVSYDEEPPGNHVLRWSEGERGYALQAMGRLPDPQVLVRIADELRG